MPNVFFNMSRCCADPSHFAQGGIELGLQLCDRAGLGPWRRPPGVFRGKGFVPRVKMIGAQAQLLRDHTRRLATGPPVGHGFALEGWIEFTMRSHRRFFNRFAHSLLAYFSVRQFEATPDLFLLSWFLLSDFRPVSFPSA